MATSGYNSVLQISQASINNTLGAVFKSGVIQTHYEGRQESAGQIPGLAIALSYKIDVHPPTVELLEKNASAASIGAGIDATLKLEIIAASGHNLTPSPSVLVDVKISAAMQGDVSLTVESLQGRSYFAVDFAGLRRLSIKIDDRDIAERYREIIHRLLERVLLVSLRNKIGRVPISTLFKSASLVGWPVADTVIQVVSSGGDRALCLALETEPNRGAGSTNGLSLLTAGKSFAVAINEAFLIQTLDYQWRQGVIPSRFDLQGKPDPTGDIRLKVFNFSLRNGKLAISVNAALEAGPGTQDIWIHGEVGVAYKDSKFRITKSNVSVEVPWAIHLLGFITFRIYYVLLVLVATELVGSMIGAIGDRLLEAFLNDGGFDLLYEGDIPGTSLKAVVKLASLDISDDEICSTGTVTVT